MAKISASNNPPTFSSGAKFDSNSVLEICMGDAGNYEISCEIKDLTILYNTLQPSQHQLHLNHRKIITNLRKNNFISNSDWKL